MRAHCVPLCFVMPRRKLPNSDALSCGVHGGTRDIPYLRDDCKHSRFASDRVRLPAMHELLPDRQRSAHGDFREALPNTHSPMDARRVQRRCYWRHGFPMGVVCFASNCGAATDGGRHCPSDARVIWVGSCRHVSRSSSTFFPYQLSLVTITWIRSLPQQKCALNRQFVNIEYRSVPEAKVPRKAMSCNSNERLRPDASSGLRVRTPRPCISDSLAPS